MTLSGVTIAVLVIFNLPILVVLFRLPFVADLSQALKEKSPVGGAQDTTSYSRVTGLVGAVIVTSFFWAVGNVILVKAFGQASEIKTITDNVGRFFLVGAALFLPYAFNQIKSAFGNLDGNSSTPPPAHGDGGT